VSVISHLKLKPLRLLIFGCQNVRNQNLQSFATGIEGGSQIRVFATCSRRCKGYCEAIAKLSRGYRETSSCRAAPTPPTARRPLLLRPDTLGAAHAKIRPPRRALCSAQVAFFLFAALRTAQRSSRTPPAAACAPAAADWGLGDLRAVAGDVFRMILPLLALQGAR